MKKTLKNHYIEYLRERNGTWYLGVELEKLAPQWETKDGGRYSASNGARTLRLLCTQSKLKRRYNGKGLAEYSYRASQESML